MHKWFPKFKTREGPPILVPLSFVFSGTRDESAAPERAGSTALLGRIGRQAGQKWGGWSSFRGYSGRVPLAPALGVRRGEGRLGRQADDKNLSLSFGEVGAAYP